MNFIRDEIHQYSVAHSTNPSSVCRELEGYTREKVPFSLMLAGPLEASLLQFLARSVSAKRALEVGTYTGYTTLALAEALPAGGEVVTLDINPETVDVGREFWAKSPHGKKIKAVIGPALESLASLKAPFDLVFIDADKPNYPHYLEWALKLLSPQGVIVIDNTLWDGRVLEQTNREAETVAIRALNEALAKRSDLHVTLLPIRDGVTLVTKRQS